MISEDRIKLFGMSHAQVESKLDKVEIEYKIDLQRGEENDRDEIYYPQFDLTLRREATHMGKHYELFYSLENSIRKLIAETLKGIGGEKWWDDCVPDTVKSDANTNIQKELDSGVTPRSEYEIDYTTFGQLGEIVRNNWDSFGGTFSSLKAFSKIMTSLNTLRGPIAHSSPLAEDEVIRLQLTLKDWFRLME